MTYRTFEPNRVISANYVTNCKERLQGDFPSIPLSYVWPICRKYKYHYVVVYEELRNAAAKVAQGDFVYKPLQRPRSHQSTHVPPPFDEEFNRELEWFASDIEKRQVENDFLLAEKFNDEEYETTGSLLECGCCYSDYAFEKMVQCEDGHLFCTECIRRAAETQIGLRRTELKCISGDGCEYSFARAQLLKVLPPNVFEGWEKIKAEEYIRSAGISNLVMCPFCDYAAEVMDPNDRDFRCAKEDCEIVSCRSCKRKSHLPLSCEENAKDFVMDARHKIEEAMSEALIRECPKCHKKFYKEEGCNKMVCQCGTIICYCCRAVIKGYDHFTQTPSGAANTKHKLPEKGCPLFDNTALRNESDVKAAAEIAAKATEKEIPSVDAERLRESVQQLESAGPKHQGQQAQRPAAPIVRPADQLQFILDNQFEAALQVAVNQAERAYQGAHNRPIVIGANNNSRNPIVIGANNNGRNNPIVIGSNNHNAQNNPIVIDGNYHNAPNNPIVIDQPPVGRAATHPPRPVVPNYLPRSPNAAPPAQPPPQNYHRPMAEGGGDAKRQRLH